MYNCTFVVTGALLSESLSGFRAKLERVRKLTATCGGAIRPTLSSLSSHHHYHPRHHDRHHHHHHIIKPVQFVEVEDGQEDTKQVDQNPDRVQHIVTVGSLRPRFRSYFLISIIIRERKDM